VSGATISVTKKFFTDSTKHESLLTADGKLHKKVQEALTEIFHRFVSPEGNMSLVDLVKFTKVAVCIFNGIWCYICIGDYTVSETDNRVKNLFNRCTTLEKPYITLDKFLKFYEISAKEKEKTVWMNLAEFGYRPENLFVQEKNISSSDQIENCRQFPRFLLANTEKYFLLLQNLFRIFYNET